MAGRIVHLELTPFLSPRGSASTLWIRGGFPESLLASSEEGNFDWRVQFIRTCLERDIPLLGGRIAPGTLVRLRRMCAPLHGQVPNLSQLGSSLGVSHTTVRAHLDLLAATFMVRLLPPLLPNLRKRLVKSTRLYLRDSGILHALLEVESFDASGPSGTQSPSLSS